MSAVAALLDSRSALVSLRRTLAPVPPSVIACHGAPRLRRALEDRVLDAIVIGQKALRSEELLQLRGQFPALPIVVYGTFKPDDGDLLARLDGPGGVAAVAVEGVDDALVGEIVRRAALSTERRRLLISAPRYLRLSEPIQQRAWSMLVGSVALPVRTDEVAKWMGTSREHLSRQFAAGGAPNLKRVIDMLRVVTATQLLANPGYTIADVARLLGFASTAHFGLTVNRIAKVETTDLRRIPPARIFEAFVRHSMRSRR
ncbi:MAG TPA: helix-turn-helix domain-containing protein [Gemmatimonadales bacterium]|nr:helix-turn-helix domain-containing protein [Gemmatimonadales bacterium]